MVVLEGKWLPRAKACCVSWLFLPAVSNTLCTKEMEPGSISRFENRNRGSSEAWRGMGVGRVGKTVCSRSQISCCLPAPACYFKWLCGSCPGSGKSYLTFNPLQLIKRKKRNLSSYPLYVVPTLSSSSLVHESTSLHFSERTVPLSSEDLAVLHVCDGSRRDVTCRPPSVLLLRGLGRSFPAFTSHVETAPAR